jgi:hypothetical protein
MGKGEEERGKDWERILKIKKRRKERRCRR